MLRKIEGLENNCVSVTVSVIETLGDRMDVYLATQAGQKLIANVEPHTKICIDEKIIIYFDTAKLYIFEPGDTGKNVCL